MWEHTAEDPLVQVYYHENGDEVVYRESAPGGWDPVEVKKAKSAREAEKARVARHFMNSFNEVQQRLGDVDPEFDFSPGAGWQGGEPFR